MLHEVALALARVTTVLFWAVIPLSFPLGFSPWYRLTFSIGLCKSWYRLLSWLVAAVILSVSILTDLATVLTQYNLGGTFTFQTVLVDANDRCPVLSYLCFAPFFP